LDRVDTFLSNILKTVNDAVPKRVVKYREIVEKGVEYVETVGGGKHFFEPAEVRRLGEKLPSEILDDLHLPFIFVKNSEVSEPVYHIRVYGREAEAFQILMDLKILPRNEKGPYTYKPILSNFINKYPTLAVLSFL